MGETEEDREKEHAAFWLIVTCIGLLVICPPVGVIMTVAIVSAMINKGVDDERKKHKGGDRCG